MYDDGTSNGVPYMKVLALSSNYEPLGVISWIRAVTLIYSNKVTTLEEYDHEIRSPSISIKAPAVVLFKNNYDSINTYGRIMNDKQLIILLHIFTDRSLKDLKYNNRGTNKKIGIFEPNISVMKWFLPAVFICENTYRKLEDKNKIEKVVITNLAKHKNNKNGA